MTLDKYQEFCNSVTKTGDRCDNITYIAIAINEEAGEIAGKVKKLIRDDYSVLTETRRLAIIKECGDVLYYLGAMCHFLDSTLAEAAQSNVDKYNDRKSRGKLHGDGDER